MVGRLVVLGTRKSNPVSTERQSYHAFSLAVKHTAIFVAKPSLRDRAPGRVPREGKIGQVVVRNAVSLIAR
jgi:hypothetical protein